MSVVTAQPRLPQNYTLASNEGVINGEGNDTILIENEDPSDEQKKKKEVRRINEEKEETCCCPALYCIVEFTDCCCEIYADCIQECCENSSGNVSNDTSAVGCCDLGCGDEGCGDGGCGDGCCDCNDD